MVDGDPSNEEPDYLLSRPDRQPAVETCSNLGEQVGAESGPRARLEAYPLLAMPLRDQQSLRSGSRHLPVNPMEDCTTVLDLPVVHGRGQADSM